MEAEKLLCVRHIHHQNYSQCTQQPPCYWTCLNIDTIHRLTDVGMATCNTDRLLLRDEDTLFEPFNPPDSWPLPVYWLLKYLRKHKHASICQCLSKRNISKTKLITLTFKPSFLESQSHVWASIRMAQLIPLTYCACSTVTVTSLSVSIITVSSPII